MTHFSTARRLFVFMAAILVSTGAIGDSLQPSLSNYFEAQFLIDSTFTTDGKTYEVSASGEAGPYGRAYLSYVFTDKQELGNRGEFTGFAWTQSGEDIITATLQGIYVKRGEVFKLHTLDTTSQGKFTYAVGTMDFVAKTLTFQAADLAIN